MQGPKVPNFLGEFLKLPVIICSRNDLAVEPMVILGKSDVVVLDERLDRRHQGQHPGRTRNTPSQSHCDRFEVLTDGR